MITKSLKYLPLLLLSGISQAWAVDTDGDGSDSAYEAIAGTSDADATQRPNWWIELGGAVGDDFGDSVESAGDVNNDGYPDVIIGEKKYGPTDIGAIHVISGLDGSVLYNKIGSVDGEQFGAYVSGAGDINNDGYDDFMATIPSTSIAAGRVKIFSGQDGLIIRELTGMNENDFFGGFSLMSAIGALGDVNADGYDDVVVGDNSSQNVKVFSGLNGDVLYTVTDASSVRNTHIKVVGDVDGDGVTDFARSPQGNSLEDTYVIVTSGISGTDITTLPLSGSQIGYGGYMDAAGDINNDGYNDLIVEGDNLNSGCPGNPCQYLAPEEIISINNESLLYKDVAGHENLDTSFQIATRNYDTDNHVAPAGDFNNDGYDDFIIGSDDVAPFQFGGRFAIYSGLDGARLLDLLHWKSNPPFRPYSESQKFKAIGDLDNDGHQDYVLFGLNDKVRFFLFKDLINDQDWDYVVNGADTDDDGDGWLDTDEGDCNKSAVEVRSFPIDTDGDGTCNFLDGDDDNDGYYDSEIVLYATSFDQLDPEWSIEGGWSIQTGALARTADSYIHGVDEYNCGFGNCSSVMTFTFDYPAAAKVSFWGSSNHGSPDTGKLSLYLDDVLVGTPGFDKYSYSEKAIGIGAAGSHEVKWNTELQGGLTVRNGPFYLDDLTVVTVADAFPLDATEQFDTDGDGIGNNTDWDDDNDGVLDAVDAEPLNNANTSEITLPLDSAYKGNRESSSPVAQ